MAAKAYNELISFLIKKTNSADGFEDYPDYRSPIGGEWEPIINYLKNEQPWYFGEGELKEIVDNITRMPNYLLYIDDANKIINDWINHGEPIGLVKEKIFSNPQLLRTPEISPKSSRSSSPAPLPASYPPPYYGLRYPAGGYRRNRKTRRVHRRVKRRSLRLRRSTRRR